MRTARILLGCVLLLVGGTSDDRSIAAGTLEAGGVIEAVGPGQVNWSAGMIMATGQGAPPANATGAAQSRMMAERAAKVDAYRNLLETVKGVRVDAATLVENMMVSSDVIKVKVEGVVKGARVLKTSQQPDGGAEVVLGIPLTGDLVDVVLPRNFGRAPAGAPFRAEPTPKVPSGAPPAPVPAPAIPQAPAQTPAPPQPVLEAPAGEKFTGLLVDARGLGARPAMAPKLLDEQGKELYATGVLDRDKAIEAGIAGYTKDLVAGSKQPRVTDNPLIVKGVRAGGEKNTDVTLNAEDTKRLSQAEAAGQFLRQGRVVFVVD